jgi:STE24 endopeptidase
MLIIVLLALALSLSTAQFAPLWNLGYLCLAGIAVYWLVAAGLGRWLARATIQAGSGQFSPQARPGRLTMIQMLAQFWLVAGSALTLTLGLSDLIDNRWGLAGWPIIPKLITLTPFIVALLIYWTQEYPGYRASKGRQILAAQQSWLAVGPIWTIRQYLSYNSRHHLLFILVPICLILLGQDLLAWAVNSYMPGWQYGPYIIGGGGILCAASVFVIAPAIIVRIWRTTAMPPGLLLTGLTTISKQMGLAFRKLLIWQTGNMIVNACVMGIWSPIRYVLLSDELIDNMEQCQIEAVFAHEAGHIVHRHILYCGLFAAGSIGLASCIVEVALRLTGWPSQAGEAMILAIMLPLWAFAFGWISRRFERQSDVTAAWVMGQLSLNSPDMHPGPGHVETSILRPADDTVRPIGAAIFARALERVALLSGTSMSKFNWRHGSIAWRVGYIIYLGSTGGGRRQINKVVGRIKAGLWIAFGLAVGGVAILSIY